MRRRTLLQRDDVSAEFARLIGGRADPVLASVRAKLIALLAESGRIMEATELATALLTRRGTAEQSEPVRRAVALAVVRAAVEMCSELSSSRG